MYMTKNFISSACRTRIATAKEGMKHRHQVPTTRMFHIAGKEVTILAFHNESKIYFYINLLVT